jgi:hypothetical protein
MARRRKIQAVPKETWYHSRQTTLDAETAMPIMRETTIRRIS